MEQISLPKNIRQIGQADKEPKIYIEDYVIMFARKMAEKNERGLAVLLGKENKKNPKEPIFIKGAVQIADWEESERIVFDNEIWSNIYEGVKNYFPELEIVGWMLLRSGQEAGFEGKANVIQKNNFKESGDILFVFDREEKEETFYRFEGGNFTKQPGYYIYYEKNEPMQSYMIDLFGNKSQEPAGEDKVMEQVRELVANKESYQEKKTGNFIYAASTALAAVVLVMGAATLNNYDRMENMEKTLDRISANMDESSAEESEGEDSLVVETITGTVGELVENEKENADSSQPENAGATGEANMEEENISQVEEAKEDEALESKDNAEDGETENDETKDTETKDTETDDKQIIDEETETTMSEGNYYIVKKGDTLVTICGAIYGSDEYVEQIKEMNQIDNADMIYEGQKLIMP